MGKVAHQRLDTTPYWAAVRRRAFPPLRRDLSVDAVVIGGGITGVTAAYLLKRAGLSVALVERHQCGDGETGHTTAHLSAVADRPFPELVRTFGEAHAQAVWDAGFAALAEIESIVRREDIACEFRWVPGYLTTNLVDRSAGDLQDLRTQAEAAAAAGFDAEFMDTIPGLDAPGVRFDGQAKFHPMKYLSALANAIPGSGGHVFEQSNVDEIARHTTGHAKSEDPKWTIVANGHQIQARFVVVATHTPLAAGRSFLGATLLQADLYPYSTYAIGARVPRGRLPEALYWDNQDPYLYLRIDPHSTYDFAVFGGSDHKTGQADDTRDAFDALERRLERMLPEATVTHRWSGQVIESRDGLPYIGEAAPKLFVASGFSGNGLTFGTLAALMVRDAVTGHRNPWRDLFSPTRTELTTGLRDYVAENKDYPYYLVRDRFAGADGKSLRAVAAGEGRIIELNGQKVAASRDEAGSLTLLSPVCTHLGCLVRWNAAESSWDCPCHGSRFTATGDVMAGPAESPLEPHRPKGRSGS
jgi:glycine/D-amino acid oxidase-like deaminating enzyme/nitrite reductase/ring-hydroxylating ferredoxin subunit